MFSAIRRFLQAPGRREPQWGGEDVSSNGVSFIIKTSKMNFTNKRLTSLRICKLRAYLEKLIGRWYGYSGWSGLYDGQGSQVIYSTFSRSDP